MRWQAAAFHRLSVNIKQLFLANFVVDSTGNFIVFSTETHSRQQSGTV